MSHRGGQSGSAVTHRTIVDEIGHHPLVRAGPPEGSTAVSDGLEGTRVPRRTLAGATVLQIVPALYEEPNSRAAVNVAFALLQAGPRARVRAADGALDCEARARRGAG